MVAWHYAIFEHLLDYYILNDTNTAVDKLADDFGNINLRSRTIWKHQISRISRYPTIQDGLSCSSSLDVQPPRRHQQHCIRSPPAFSIVLYCNPRLSSRVYYSTFSIIGARGNISDGICNSRANGMVDLAWSSSKVKCRRGFAVLAQMERHWRIWECLKLASFTRTLNRMQS